MDWNILARKLAAKGFTVLGGALAGPAGAVVGAQIADHIGVDPTPDAVAKAFVHDPQTELALRQLERELAADERAFRTELLAEDKIDRDDARRVFKASPMPALVFFTVAAMAVAFVYAVLFHSYAWTGEQWDFVKFVGPILIGTLLVTVVGYFIGSSNGSADKARTIERAISK
jgi:cytochrome c-type biogenesis protein CcmH/NrfG